MASGWISKKARQTIYSRDAYVCCYCNKKCCQWTPECDVNNFATLDHIVARVTIAKSCADDAEFSKELKNPKNLVTVCNACNSSKKHTDLFVWCKSKKLDYAKIIIRIGKRTGKST